MKIKFLQLNTWHGRHLSEIVKFVKKGKFDLFNFQEVSGGSIAYTGEDNYKNYKRKFPGYNSELAVKRRRIEDPQSYFGNATFYKSKFQLLSSDVIWLKRSPTFDYESKQWQKSPINALSKLLKFGECEFYVINTHLVWGPTDKERKFKRKQNKKLVSYIQSLKKPFILSGDFNIGPDAQTVKDLGKISQNLTAQNKITNTLNPRTHYAKHLFPKGLAVDYIFVSEHFRVKKFRLVGKPELSDHFALEAELML